MFVAQYNGHVIQQYTLDGQLIRSYGTYGSSGVKLKSPFLTGHDKFNSVLVAGKYNYNLDALNPLSAR